MDWHDHVTKTSGKIAQIGGVINKLKCILPENVLLIIYNTLVLPHINYGIIIWGYQHFKISLAQKKDIRSVTCSPYLSHSEPLFKKLKLLKVEVILKCNN